MTLELVIRCIGFSHLLQPPLTLLLARRMRLADAFTGLPALPAQIVRNMAFASVGLPTATGVLVGFFAHDVVSGGTMRSMAWVISAFWTWRLARQAVLGSLLPGPWHWALTAIFCTQGPAFAGLLLWTAAL